MTYILTKNRDCPEFPDGYLMWVNEPDKEEDIFAIRNSINKGVPFGKSAWVDAMVEAHGLESTRRKTGRPKKG